MRTYRFFHVDVFTDKPFGGNPLAVFPEAEGLSDREMQLLAKELNLSETTFVLPSKDPRADCRVRIFTPETEVPLAGHPVLGTHFVLAQLGRYVLKEPITRIHQELQAGVLPVDLYVKDGHVERVVMTQAQPQFLAAFTDTPRLAAAVGLQSDEIDTRFAPQVVSTGLPQLMIPVRSLAAVQKAKPDLGTLPSIAVAAGTECFVLFTRETLFPESTAHVRMFAPGFGILEDPATGSAAGGLSAYMVRYGVIPIESGTTHVIIEQGYEMSRPSTLHAEVDGTPEKISAVRVGGRVAPLIEGMVRL